MTGHLLLWLAGALGLVAAGSVLAMTEAERAAILAPTTDFSKAEPHEAWSGGTATNRKRLDREAFSQPSASLPFSARGDFFVGNGFFKRLWVTAPSSTGSADGLGPLYNARACQRCHLKDGRGHPPAGPDDNAVSMFLRLSIPPETSEQEAAIAAHEIALVPEPTYGGQLQDFAIPGHPAEGRMVITYTEIPVELAGGEVVHLRQPHYSVADLGYGPLHPDLMLSPRVAQPMIGLGLLEAIDEADILAAADPDDADGDGISGRPNWAWSPAEERVALGRFGWKAGKATIPDQAAAAMAGDIGVGNPLAPSLWGDCTDRQVDCQGALHGGVTRAAFEADHDVMALIDFYSRHLAVPARRDVDDPTVLRGKELFYGAGCTACHTPKHATRRDWPVDGLAGQLIWPDTDLLLHDMGEGLADGRPEGEANGREWRSQPLWGIGLTEAVNGHSFFLHDGRARNLTEAILWHGGEAEPARDLPPDAGSGSRRPSGLPELAVTARASSPRPSPPLPLGALAQSEADDERLNSSLTEGAALPAIGGLAAATASKDASLLDPATSPRRAWRCASSRHWSGCWQTGLHRSSRIPSAAPLPRRWPGSRQVMLPISTPRGWATTALPSFIITAAAGIDACHDAAEAARDDLEALSHGLERATSQELLAVLAEIPKNPRPKAVESWRSGGSTANLSANLEPLGALLATEGGFADFAAAPAPR